MAVYLLRDKAVSYALSQVGYKEKSGNWNKYAQELDSVNYFAPQKKQCVAWCNIFVDDVIYNASGKDKAKTYKALYQPSYDNLSAACKYAAQYFRKNNAWSKTATVGAQIFFGKQGAETHTGLVVAVGVSTITTVEGNKGNMVKKCSYSKNDSKIAGYGLIKYDTAPQPDPPSPQPEPPKPEPTPSPTPKGKKYKCTCSKGVNIRAGAGATYKKVGAVNYGQIVTIYSTKNGWGNMTTSGNRWVCMKYFKAV
jgi:hypothetical protein